MMASEWQVGKTALGHVMDPLSSVRAEPLDPLFKNASPSSEGGPSHQDGQSLRPITDAMEQLEDHQGLVELASKREEVFEASTESEVAPGARRTAAAAPLGPDGAPMTRAERIAYQKKQREEQEERKERIYDNSKMVHELKDVLGRRRHLREHDDEGQEDEESVHAAQALPYKMDPSAPTPFSTSSSSDIHIGKEFLSLGRELSLSMSRVPTAHISPFTLSTPIFSHEENEDLTVTEPYVEISGMGEAEYEEETEDQEQDMQGQHAVQDEDNGEDEEH